MSATAGYQCRTCGFTYLAPQQRCTQCGSDERDPVSLSGRGRIRAWTTIHIAPTRYEDEAPYTVVLVDLEEGIAVMGRLTGDAPAEQGASVTVTAVDAERGPMFEPAGGPATSRPPQ